MSSAPLDSKGTETSNLEQDPRPEGPKGPEEPGTAAGPRGLRLPVWMRILPLFLSALFFLSAFFALFSPAPLIFIYFRLGRAKALLVALLNILLVGVANLPVGGPTGAYVAGGAYAVFVVVLAFAACELMRMRFSVEKTALGTMICMALVGLGTLAFAAHLHHQSLGAEVQSQITSLTELFAQSASNEKIVPLSEREEWKQSVAMQIPSGIAIFALVAIWANLVLVLRLNPAGIREKIGLRPDFIQNWKAPEFLVWPTILCGIFLVWEVERVTPIAVNVFNFLMVIYAIQGLSILSFFLNRWRMSGFFRILSFMIALFMMLPMVLSLGFFDLWFDFRKKFRQS